MALIIIDVPAIREKLKEEVLGWALDSGVFRFFFGDVQPEDLGFGLAIPIYSLSYRELAGFGVGTSVEPAFWRMVIFEGEEVLSFADVHSDNDGGLAVLRIGSREVASGLALGMKKAIALYRDENGDGREVRGLVEIEGPYLRALWIVGKEEVFIPISPIFLAVEANVPHSRERLINIVKEFNFGEIEDEPIDIE